MRRIFKNDKYSALIAGFISSFALAFEKPNRRISIALYLFTRSVHAAWLKADGDYLKTKIKNGEIYVT